MALAAALLAGRRSPWLSLRSCCCCSAAWRPCSSSPSALERVWLAALPPAAAVLLAGLAVEALRLADERRRRRRLERQKANLARYFAPAVVERLAASDSPAGLDRTQEAVVMFVDIVGFTRLSEGMAPAAAMALLREFHTRVERAVFDAWRHGRQVHGRRGHGLLRRAGPVAGGGRRRDPRRAGAARAWRRAGRDRGSRSASACIAGRC